jgi:hypothetical protein
MKRIQIVDLNGKVVASGKNLAVLQRYHANKHGVAQVVTTRNADGTGTLNILFRDKTTAHVEFGDWRVLEAWCARKRSWSQAYITNR